MKVFHSLLEGHLPRGTAFKGQTFAPLAIAGLFVDFIRSSICHGREIEPSHYASVSGQILDLLALTLTSRDGAVESAETSVQEAHLSRIKALIRNSLFEPGLTPAHIAAKCRLSVSYLHRLFASTGTTMGVGSARSGCLRAIARCEIRDIGESLAAVAQQFGFSDQPQFCRHYKRRFGRTPAKFALRPAMRRDMQNGSGTEFELARCWLNRGASQPTPRSFLKSRRCILVEKENEQSRNASASVRRAGRGALRLCPTASESQLNISDGSTLSTDSAPVPPNVRCCCSKNYHSSVSANGARGQLLRSWATAPADNSTQPTAFARMVCRF